MTVLRFLWRSSLALGGLLPATACTAVSEADLICRPEVDCTINDTVRGLFVFVPGSAIPNGIQLRAIRVDNPPDSATIVPGATWELLPDTATLNPRAIVAVTIPRSALGLTPGVRAAELRVYRREDIAWVPVDSQSVDTTNLVVTARLNRLGTYTVMGEPASTATISPAQASLVVGGSVRLVATVRSAGGTPLPTRDVAWSSSNPLVVSVDSTGAARGESPGAATVTGRASTATGTALFTVDPPGPPPVVGEPQPGAGDVVIYDDDFSGFSTMDLRHARRNQLIAGATPFYFFDGPLISRQALDSIITPGMGASPYAYRVRVPASANNNAQLSMGGEVVHRSPIAPAHFNPDGTTLVVDMWIRVNYPQANLYWIKNLELFHSFDRTQYGVMVNIGHSLGWANIHPQSNNLALLMHDEDGASDAPARFRRWPDVSTGTWLKHTHVYRASSGTGTSRDGVARWYVDGEKIIDASPTGLNTGWMKDRRNGVDVTSTNPYPGNSGWKYTDTTGDQVLLNLADDPVIAIVWPGIISTSAIGGGGTLDVGRIRIWYRP